MLVIYRKLFGSTLEAQSKAGAPIIKINENSQLFREEKGCVSLFPLSLLAGCLVISAVSVSM